MESLEHGQNTSDDSLIEAGNDVGLEATQPVTAAPEAPATPDPADGEGSDLGYTNDPGYLQSFVS